MTSRTAIVVLSLAALAASGRAATAQQPGPPPKPPAVERLGPTTLRVGQITVDTAKREISVRGRMNDVMVLEWIANTREGMKAYESAMTLETDAITFNAALLLIGLDPARSKVPARHFDPNPPAGDPVELTVEWSKEGVLTRIPVARLMWDRERLVEPPTDTWVYTGSTFVADSGRYMADLDGVLIGFVHSPAPIIEQVGGTGVGRFGWIVPNPNLGLAPNTPVTLFVRSLAPARR